MEYLIKTGSERVAQQCRENIYAVQTLKDFQYIDRDGKDQVNKHTPARNGVWRVQYIIDKGPPAWKRAKFRNDVARYPLKDILQWISDLLCKYTNPTLMIFMGCW